ESAPSPLARSRRDRGAHLGGARRRAARHPRGAALAQRVSPGPSPRTGRRPVPRGRSLPGRCRPPAGRDGPGGGRGPRGAGAERVPPRVPLGLAPPPGGRGGVARASAHGEAVPHGASLVARSAPAPRAGRHQGRVGARALRVGVRPGARLPGHGRRALRGRVPRAPGPVAREQPALPGGALVVRPGNGHPRHGAALRGRQPPRARHAAAGGAGRQRRADRGRHRLRALAAQQPRHLGSGGARARGLPAGRRAPRGRAVGRVRPAPRGGAGEGAVRGRRLVHPALVHLPAPGGGAVRAGPARPARPRANPVRPRRGAHPRRRRAAAGGDRAGDGDRAQPRRQRRRPGPSHHPGGVPRLPPGAHRRVRGVRLPAPRRRRGGRGDAGVAGRRAAPGWRAAARRRAQRALRMGERAGGGGVRVPARRALHLAPPAPGPAAPGRALRRARGGGGPGELPVQRPASLAQRARRRAFPQRPAAGRPRARGARTSLPVVSLARRRPPPRGDGRGPGGARGRGSRPGAPRGARRRGRGGGDRPRAAAGRPFRQRALDAAPGRRPRLGARGGPVPAARSARGRAGGVGLAPLRRAHRLPRGRRPARAAGGAPGRHRDRTRPV
ncbi:MAG: hypothetical protein AVDCRST_MAG68-3736, partial [uncultured Gemmatimonadetes bacterium]